MYDEKDTDRDNEKDPLEPSLEDNRSKSYRSPPIEHRWKKGQSGNPTGKRKAAAPSDTIVGDLFGKQRLHSLTATQRLLKKELSRPIRMRDGDKVTSTTAHDLIVRGLVTRAAKGNDKAFHQLSRLIDRIERGDAARQAAILEGVAKYKRDAAAQYDAARRAKVAAPDIVPHPDDMEIDPETGEIRFLGPSTREEKLALEAMVAALPQLCAELLTTSKKIADDDKDLALRARQKQLPAQIDAAITYFDRKVTRERARSALEGGGIFYKDSESEREDGS